MSESPLYGVEPISPRKSLSRGYIAALWPAVARRERPAPPKQALAALESQGQSYPEGGKLIDEFGSRPPRADAGSRGQENPYREGISTAWACRDDAVGVRSRTQTKPADIPSG